ncbi:hypothetical protein GCM10028895_34740 [Pontibacter rugosus]
MLYYDATRQAMTNPQGAKFVEVIERKHGKAKDGIITLYKIVSDTSDYIALSKAYYTSVYEPRKIHGQLLTFFPNGKRHSIQFSKGEMHGELKTYYTSGLLKREELYENGERLGGKCYDEKGKEVAFVPYREKPLFPGGEQAMLRFLGQNTRYPASSQRRGISGVVVISFIVDENGELCNPVVAQSVDQDLDNEALRVVKKMPKWQPAKLEGKAVSAKYNLPVRFSLGR